MADNACRHFNGFRGCADGTACAMGRNPRAWVIRICGDDHGMFYKVPCTKQSDKHNPVFDCPELDRKTRAEIDAERAEISRRMDALIRALPTVNEMRSKMVSNGLRKAKATCPWCDAKDALDVSCAIGVNDHIHCKCRECGAGFME